MTDRLNNTAANLKRTAQEWCDRGNALLAGTEPTTKGEYLRPRHDVHWVIRNGHPTIEYR